MRKGKENRNVRKQEREKKGISTNLYLFSVLGRGCLDELRCGGFDSFDAFASVFEHPLEELLLLQLRLDHLEVGRRRLLIGDHVLGLVEPAEERLQSLLQLARVQ